MLDAGAAESMDALSVHLYPIGRMGTTEDLFTPSLAVTSDLASSSDLPIWITETGVTTQPGAFAPPVTEAEQAVELDEIYETAASSTQVEAVAFHTLLDPDSAVPGGPGFGWFAEHEQGAVRPKPVVCAFRAKLGLPGCPTTIDVSAE